MAAYRDREASGRRTSDRGLTADDPLERILGAEVGEELGVPGGLLRGGGFHLEAPEELLHSPHQSDRFTSGQLVRELGREEDEGVEKLVT